MLLDGLLRKTQHHVLMDYLDKEIKSLKEQIAAHIKDDPELKTKRDLLKSIPGIGEATIAAILAAPYA